MKIIITEDRLDKLKELIKTQGVKKTAQLAGGINTLAKVLGFDTIPEYIYQYLTENTYPDYGWESHDFYREQVDKYGDHQFYINDKLSFDYTNSGKFILKTKLDIYPWLYDELGEIFEVDGEDIFGWKDVFKKWFTDNTGLKVDIII